MWFTEDFLDFEVKNVLGVDRREHNGGICSPTAAGDSNNFLVSAHQATVSRHKGDFTGYLQAVTKDTQGIGDYLTDDLGIEFLAHRPANSSEGVGSGKYCATLALNYLPVLLGKPLDIGLVEAGLLGFGFYTEP